MRKHRSIAAMFAATAALMPGAALTDDSVTVGGFIKLNATVTDYEYGSLDGSSLKDFYLAQTIPVEGAGESEGPEFDLTARETRFWLKSAHDIGGHKVGTHLEMDFMVTGTPDERTTNPYNPRIRHAFITYDNWMFGQNWTTFFNVGALPEGADFIGPAEATVFVRQAQIRYTSGPWMFALENPETTITPFGGGARVTTDDGVMPDLVLRYNAANFSIAAIARQLKEANSAISGDDETVAAFGISISGKYPIGANGDDIRFMINTGSGLGRYIGVNYANGAVRDADGSLEAIDLTSAYVAYRHVWNERYRSNFTFSTISVDNDPALTGGGVGSTGSSLHANVIYTPVKNLDFAYELIYGMNELESEAEGSMTRFQFSAKYTF